MDAPRRRILEVLGTAGIAALAGCNSTENDGTPVESSPTGTLTEREGDGDPQTTATPAPKQPSVPTEQAVTISPDDGASKDLFGKVAVLAGDGSTAAIAAPNDGGRNDGNRGSVYVFARSGGSWSRQTKLTASDGDKNDFFGQAVSMSNSGSTVVVGAPGDDVQGTRQRGSAYVFRRSGGSWSQDGHLVGEGIEGNGYPELGKSVAVSADGDTVLAGVPGDYDPNGSYAGSTCVFARSSGSWSQQAKLAAGDGNEEDFFGRSVAMANDSSTVAVGAPDEEDPNGSESGAVYVFVRSGGGWSQTAKLTAGDGDERDFLGRSVSISGDGSTVIAGADRDEDPAGDASGSAYVFGRSGGSWTQQVKLAADDGDASDRFGTAVSISETGSTVVVGADRDDSTGKNAGSAYAFARSDGSWSQQAKLVASEGNKDAEMGASVSVSADGTMALVGAPWELEPNGYGGGSAYIFE